MIELVSITVSFPPCEIEYAIFLILSFGFYNIPKVIETGKKKAR